MKRWTLSAAAVLAVLAGLEPFAPARGSAGPDRAVVELALVNPVPGLVAAYGFEAGSGEIVFDSSGSGNNGTIRSATWTTAGRFGGALDFNGTDSWVVIPDAASLDLTTGMTLEAWVAPDVLPSETCTRTNCSWMDVVHKDSDRYYIEATSNVGRRPEVGGIFTSGKHILFGPEPLPTHAWTHLALTFDGATLRFYVDAELVASESQSAPLTISDHALYIGGDATMGQFFDGRIDEVRVYDLARTQEQILEDMNTSVVLSGNAPPIIEATADRSSGTTPLVVAFSSGGTHDPELQPLTYDWEFGDGSSSGETNPIHTYETQGVFTARLTVSDGVLATTSDDLILVVADDPGTPVAAYGFNEGSGATVPDLSGHGNTGTLLGPTWTTSGRFGQALTFGGGGQRVRVEDAPSLDLSTGMTLEAWVYPTGPTGVWRDVIFKSLDTYYLEGSSTWGSPATGGEFTTDPLVGPEPLQSSRWSHLAATYDGASLRLFQDGVEVASRPQTGPIPASSGELTFGADAVYGQSWAGRIDEVRIYDHALHVAQIRYDMDRPVAEVASCQDTDLDGHCDAGTQPDCDDTNPDVWAVPAEVRGVEFIDRDTLRWESPADVGGLVLTYDVLRSDQAADFFGSTACVDAGDRTDTTSMDAGVPVPDGVWSFLVRASNACPSGTGTLGVDSTGQERAGASCG